MEATGLVAVLLSELLLKLRDLTRLSGVSRRIVEEYLEFADMMSQCRQNLHKEESEKKEECIK